MESLKRTHFEWFGLPERFAIDRPALDTAYREVQAAVHPDRHAAGSDADRRLAMQLATQANEAYRTLKDPVRRAAYLCERHGAPVDAENNTAMPAEFLIRQIEWREALDEARGARDLGRLDALRAEVDNERDAMLAALRERIDVQADFSAAAALVRRMMFLERIGTEIDAVEEALVG